MLVWGGGALVEAVAFVTYSVQSSVLQNYKIKNLQKSLPTTNITVLYWRKASVIPSICNRSKILFITSIYIQYFREFRRIM